MDDAERTLFASSVRQALQGRRGESFDGALDHLGWRDALAADRAGAVGVLFELQGEANATSGALDDVLLAVLGLGHQREAAIVLPAIGSGDPPGELCSGRLSVRGLGTARLARAGTAVVVATAGQGTTVVLLDTGRCHRRAVHGMDGALGLVEVGAELEGVEAAAPGPDDPWPALLSAGRLALAHELVGAAAAMLELARSHALQRVQFGRPIAAFQAVRHRLADTLVAIEGARAVLDAAWEQATPQAASMATAVAGQAARTAARHCQQVLGGMGFTTEHPLHRYVRRALVLDELLGSSRSLTRALGRQLIDSGRFPPLSPL